MVEYLLSKNADVNSRNKYGQTPLFQGNFKLIEIHLFVYICIFYFISILACAKGHKEIVKILIRNNADIHAVDMWGDNALKKG